MRAPGESSGSASPASLVEIIEGYLTAHPVAAVIEDGSVLFDMRTARYSLSLSHGRCLLQFWSEERNLVRTVVETQLRSGCLRLITRRMGVTRPLALELVPASDRRTPTAREAARRQYLRQLERVLARRFPDWKPDGFRSAADLEHSFGPAYARGQLLRGGHGLAAEAVIGVGGEESAATIDGVLTLGLLWLDYCRGHSVGKTSRNRHYGGLRVIVPTGMAQTTAERMAWLNQNAASFLLFTLDEKSEELTEVDLEDSGNIALRLLHAFDATAALERAQSGVERVLALVPEQASSRVELRARSATEVALLLHGLKFARVRQLASPSSFARQEEITFGAGANETPLTEESEALCRTLLRRLFQSRHADGTRNDPLYRLQSERWLESQIRTRLPEILPTLRVEFLYTQVPAMATGDRGMLDLLTVDRDGRLVIMEVKAEEDMHLPLQGLDYWIRVRALHADRRADAGRFAGEAVSAFMRNGYFAGVELAPQPPKLLFVAPALRIHPANEAVLKYLAPAVDWELLAVGEEWRRELKTVFRKRRE
uniref:DUF91 domain-containing protein n=1 Tax=mine drainage metagenome TaxID=410659 RepID=E6PYU4_9ZZZZ